MDEPELVRALARQDPGAVEQLVDAYGDRLLRSAVLLCGDGTEAEDLVQETFVQAMASVRRFRAQSSVYTWLHGILLNLTRHYHRDRRRSVYDNELADRAAPPAEDEFPSSLDVALASQALTAALRRISVPHREIIILRFYEEMKLEEIAQHLRLSKGTVKSRLHYALKELQQLLPEELNLFGDTGTKQMERL